MFSHYSSFIPLVFVSFVWGTFCNALRYSNQYLLMDRDEMNNLYRGPPIYASYQVSVHLAKWFQRRRFLRNQPIRNKNCLWRSCLLMDRDEMSNRNRGLSIDAFYQVSVHLAKWFQRRRIYFFR